MSLKITRSRHLPTLFVKESQISRSEFALGSVVIVSEFFNSARLYTDINAVLDGLQSPALVKKWQPWREDGVPLTWKAFTLFFVELYGRKTQGFSGGSVTPFTENSLQCIHGNFEVGAARICESGIVS